MIQAYLHNCFSEQFNWHNSYDVHIYMYNVDWMLFFKQALLNNTKDLGGSNFMVSSKKSKNFAEVL